MTLVRCSVSNCAFYKEGNLCGADVIMVDIDPHASLDDAHVEFGTDGFDAEHQDVAEHSSKTCCKTFRPIDQ